MRMALCFSGFLRNFSRTYSSWKKYFLDLYDVDTYIDTWDTINFDTDETSYDNARLIQDLYRPKCLKIERRRRDYGKKIRLAHPRQATGGDINNPIAMFYKIKSCQALCADSGEDYDLVFRARPDILLHGPFPIDSDSRRLVNVSEHSFHIDYDKIGKPEFSRELLGKYVDFQMDELQADGCIKKQGILDHLAFSSLDNMGVYCGVYDSYEQYFSEGCNVRPEIILAYHLIKHPLVMTRGFKNNFSIFVGK